MNSETKEFTRGKFIKPYFKIINTMPTELRKKLDELNAEIEKQNTEFNELHRLLKYKKKDIQKLNTNRDALWKKIIKK